MRVEESRLLELRDDAEAVRGLLPSGLRSHAVEIDGEEEEPDRYFAVNLVPDGDPQRTATFVISIPQYPLGSESMAYEKDLYLHSPYSFDAVPEGMIGNYGQYAYIRTMADGGGLQGWSLISDAVNVGLIFSGIEIDDTELWEMADSVLNYLTV